MCSWLRLVQPAVWNVGGVESAFDRRRGPSRAGRTTRQVLEGRVVISPKWIGLGGPVQVPERPCESIEMVFGRFVVTGRTHAESCVIRFSISASACVSCCFRA